jgi:chitodextrinase
MAGRGIRDGYGRGIGKLLVVFALGMAGAFHAPLAKAADTTPPTAPTNLAASVISTTQINLSWTASTDNVGVTGYRIERCTGSTCTSFAQVGTTTTALTFNNTGLTASTTYRYRVRANDAAGNLSAYSSIVNATTLTPDTQAPTAPTNLAASVISTTQINLSWTASTDNVGVTGYRIERCTGSTCTTFAQVGTTTTALTFNNTGLTASTTYRFRVRANDAAGNLSSYSSIVNATTLTPDTQAPTAPTNLAASVISTTQINLSWTASTDNVGVTGYRIERCTGSTCTTFAQVGTTTGAVTYSDTGLTATTTYRYRVRANDAAGNLSAYSSIVNATTLTPDTQAPTAPTGPTATVVSSAQINLSWTASTDNVGVSGYRVERCSGVSCTAFAQIGKPTTTTYSDTGLTASTSYSYRVRATDAAGNLSAYSSTVSATTQAPPDTQAPTVPSGLTATAVSSSQINLSWAASTDNVGVTGYRVERCAGAGCSNFVQIATPTATSYNDSGLPAGGSYSYRVRATDAAGNLSGYSAVASAGTPFGTSTYTYDSTGHLKTVTTGGTTVTYTYDAAGNVTGIQTTP